MRPDGAPGAPVSDAVEPIVGDHRSRGAPPPRSRAAPGQPERAAVPGGGFAEPRSVEAFPYPTIEAPTGPRSGAGAKALQPVLSEVLAGRTPDGTGPQAAQDPADAAIR